MPAEAVPVAADAPAPAEENVIYDEQGNKFEWRWHPEAGAFLPFSIDVLDLTPDGSIAAVTSFIGRSPDHDPEAIVDYPDTPPAGSMTERFGLPAKLER